MRKTISIFLILVLLTNLGGCYILFLIQQFNLKEQVEKELKKGISIDKLAEIVIPLNEFRKICWIEQNKEFKLNGKMYDVVKIKEENRKIHLFCFDDKKERQLVEKYIKTHNSKKDFDRKLKRPLINVFFLHQYTPLNSLIATYVVFGFLENYKSLLFNKLDIPPKSFL